MRTLYVRIITMTMAIIIVSTLAAFLMTNSYYHNHLKPANDEKLTNIATQIGEILEDNPKEFIPEYLSRIAPLGYKVHLVDEQFNRSSYGEPFKSEEIDEKDLQTVLSGGEYHGIREYPWKPFIIGFFSNELKNSVGVPIEVEGEKLALFVRADTEIMFWEMRAFQAILFILMLALALLLIIISTRFIVQPLISLREATKKIAAGNYHIKLNVNRTDEIGRLASDFMTMSESLEQIEKKRQEFVSNVSHEIQSPLTSIQGFSQALQEEEFTEEERKHYLSIIEKESRRLSALSKQLLTLSMLDQEQVIQERIEFNLEEQLQDVINTTEWQWKEKNLSVKLDTPSVKIIGERKLLHQVWSNIMSNAIRYTEDGGEIRIKVKLDRSEVIVSFTDTGIGIDEEYLPRIFERFFIVDQARTRTKPSTGLGLSIVKKIIELHDGTIMVNSKRNEGTTFTITLPTK